MKQEDRAAHLEEHIPYEALMMRYSYQRIASETHELDWNAHYCSFAVHARLLHDFLVNDGGSNNVKASDFVDGFHFERKPIIVTTINTLNQQVFHLAKRRPNAEERKDAITFLKPLHDWLNDGLARFVDELNEALRALWREERCHPPASDAIIRIRSTPPSATNNPTSSSG